MVSPLRRWLLCVTAAAALGGCLAPTLPLPPPSDPTVSGPDERGFALIEGRVEVNATVYVLNRARSAGAFQKAQDGTYSIEIRAELGDSMALWYELDGEVSEALSFEIGGP